MDGNEAQLRKVAEKLGELYNLTPPPPKPELPTPLKWAAGIIAGIMTAGSLALAMWLVTTVNQMQITLARMDERQVMNGQNFEAKFTSIETRVSKLEGYHRKES